jgi:hypothetical protein
MMLNTSLKYHYITNKQNKKQQHKTKLVCTDSLMTHSLAAKYKGIPK